MKKTIYEIMLRQQDANLQSPEETHQVTEYDELFINASKILELKQEED